MSTTAACTHPLGLSAVGKDRFRWVALQPGCGVIVQCVRCGHVARGRELPAGHAPEHWSRQDYLPDSAGLCWAETHECGPENQVSEESLAVVTDSMIPWASDCFR